MPTIPRKPAVPASRNGTETDFPTAVPDADVMLSRSTVPPDTVPITRTAAVLHLLSQ